MIFLGWSSVDPAEELGEGPWREVFRLAPGLFLFDSEASLSRVYHELKWSLPPGASVLVAPLHEAPKFLRLEHGARAWLRDRQLDR
ncbi:MAG: hypothetical protein JO291_11440 [Acidimicrobiia bacterium]|nr:hypothetical protein [Acidimicrobiia bacterium]